MQGRSAHNIVDIDQVTDDLVRLLPGFTLSNVVVSKQVTVVLGNKGLLTLVAVDPCCNRPLLQDLTNNKEEQHHLS